MNFTECKNYLLEFYSKEGFRKIVINTETSLMLKNENINNAYISLVNSNNEIKLELFNVKATFDLNFVEGITIIQNIDNTPIIVTRDNIGTFKTNAELKEIELEKKVKDIKTKYGVEITIDNYLTMENLLTSYINILARKKKELVTLDDYGNKKYDLWYQEINYFLENTFVGLLKAQNIPIYNDLIKDIISDNVEKYTENNKFIIENNIKSMSNKNVENKNVANGFLILLFIGIIFYIFSGNNKSSSYSDSNSYQDRYNSEKAQTLRDIQKAIDDAKYQEWKNK